MLTLRDLCLLICVYDILGHAVFNILFKNLMYKLSICLIYKNVLNMYLVIIISVILPSCSINLKSLLSNFFCGGDGAMHVFRPQGI